MYPLLNKFKIENEMKNNKALQKESVEKMEQIKEIWLRNY